MIGAARSRTVSFLQGAVLAPTDTVFASAIVGREEVPARLRHLLNVESGVNDGPALPIVLVLLSMAGGTVASPSPEFRLFGALLTPSFLFQEIPWTGSVLAILAHSSTDVVLAKRFSAAEPAGEPAA